MRLNLLSIPLLATSIAALPVDDFSPEANVDETRPPLKTMAQLAPKIKPAVIVDVEPLIRAGAKRQLVRYGPFNMPASKVRNTLFLFTTPTFDHTLVTYMY
jgi:hypothetical protein